MQLFRIFFIILKKKRTFAYTYKHQKTIHMKRTIITAVMLFFAITASFAQFEQGKMYIGTSFEGAGLSYSEETDFSVGLGANLGYMLVQDWLLLGEVGFDYSNSDLNEFYVGGHCRYFIEQNGIFLQAGLKYTHRVGGYNDVAITPEVGYCHYLNSHLTIEPAVYYDMSLSDFSNYSRFGLKIGLGWYF